MIHHTGCGMATFRDDDLKDAIEEETGLRPSFAHGGFPETSSRTCDSRWLASKQARLSRRKDGIRGFIYDVETGRLAEVSGA